MFLIKYVIERRTQVKTLSIGSMSSLLTVFLSISFIKLPFSFPSDFCQRSGWKLIFKGTQHYWSNFGAINGNYNQQCPPIAWYGDTCEYVFIVFHLCKIPRDHPLKTSSFLGGRGQISRKCLKWMVLFR